MRILLVDDEVELTDPLSHLLIREGYDVDVAHDGAEGGQLATENHYDLYILDWMLPKQSGIQMCNQLRSQGNAAPVLFLTAKDTIDDRVQGLDAGADDYLVKPFELRELLARIRALLRRPPILDESVGSSFLKISDLELDPVNQLAYRQQRMIELSEKEGQLLAYFMRHPNQVLSHQQIQSYLWGNEDPPQTRNALAAQIRLLRRKIEVDGEAPLIHTVYGRGYRFGEGELP